MMPFHCLRPLLLLGPVVAQDLFLSEKENQFLAKHGLAMQTVNPNEGQSNQELGLSDSPDPSSPGPGPPPSLAPESFCLDEQPGWPKYQSMGDLQNDQAWATYFQLVYGEVPSSGYPICVGSFRMLYLDLLKQAGVQYPTLGGSCGSYAGELFKFGISSFSDAASVGTMSYNGVAIWHPDSNRQALPGDTWAEITNAPASEQPVGAWYYYMPGSGVWFWLGNTAVFPDHPDAAQHFGFTCSGECDQLSSKIHQKACDSGILSIQYLEHGEHDWASCKSVSGTMSLAIEIIDTCGAGNYSCGAAAQPSWRAGWDASQDCQCDNSQVAYNCQGFIPNNR